MQVIINDRKQEIKDNMTILEILKELNIAEKAVAISVNFNVIKKDDWSKTILHNNDKIEILQFVGGG